MINYFDKAIPVFPSKYLDEINISILFVEDFLKADNMTLNIAGESEYQIFLNGQLIGYGPVKCAHNYHRISEYKLDNLLEHNRLAIVLASYRANSFDRINQSPFICYEIKSDDKTIAFSHLSSKAFLYSPRIQKVTRFSYQRTFSESYNSSYNNEIFKYGTIIKLESLDLLENKYGTFLSSNIHHPLLNLYNFSLIEKDLVEVDKTLSIYDDRYMYNQGLVIFDKSQWEVDPNKIVSQLVHKKINLLDNHLEENQSLVYSSDVSVTGFINVQIDVKNPIDLYIYFDEMNNGGDQVDFKFYRNTTHNIVSYQLNKGTYQLISFMPYTAKYMRITALKGSCDINAVSIILLENPDSHNLKYNFENKKLEAIFDAARNTFASNAVDILTDCPSRERAGWLCDSYFTGRSEKLFTGLNLVERNFLENYALYQYHGDVEKGMLPMCYPADFKNNEMYIPNWAMFYVLELESYLSRNKDEKLKDLSKNNIKNLVAFFKQYENEYELLEDLKSWVFVEWSPANDKDSIKGVNIPSNALYAKFLQSAGQILNSQDLIEKSLRIKKHIKELAFTGEFFVDNLIRDTNGDLVQNNRIGETTLYYLFYFDVIKKEDYPKVFEVMVNSFGPNRDVTKVYPNIYKSNVFIGDYLRLEILLKYGLYDEVLKETIDYFYKMAELTGTLWEHDSTFASLNHGFASFVANIIFEAITGIYKIDYHNKIIYRNKTSSKYKYSFELPIENEVILISNNDNFAIKTNGDFKIIEK